jgi:hypothetical protein
MLSNVINSIKQTTRSVFVIFVARIISVVTAAAFFNLNYAFFFAVVCVKHSAFNQSPSQVNCWEIVLSTKIIKADNSFDCNTVDKHNHSWEHLNAKLVNKEW